MELTFGPAPAAAPSPGIESRETRRSATAGADALSRRAR